MSKFNTTQTMATKNASGHAAYKMTDKAKLVSQVLTSFFNEKKFYGDNTADMIETIKRVVASDPRFVANLAVFARREFNMRSVSHVLTAYLAHESAGKPYVRETMQGVCLRGDDATEIMAFYLSTFGKPIPNSLKKGVNDVLVEYDEYTLAKYKGDSKAVKMRDLLCLCRPSPKTAEQSDLFKRCLEDRLETPLTWESELSANGNNAETWERLIDSGKVGYMALLRNLRNIITANPRNIEKVYRRIEDRKAVAKSKQLPFRFLSAYKSIAGIGGSRAFDALEAATEAACDNLPRLSGTTVIAVDSSGSMRDPVSNNSEIRCIEIGMMLGLIANRLCENAIFYTFDSVVKKQPLSRRENILRVAVTSTPSGGTNMSLPFAQMMRDKVKPDRVIIISDNECNQGRSYYTQRTIGQMAQEARRFLGVDFYVHAIDLMGYGTCQFSGKRDNILAGWSEKVLDFIRYAEMGEGNLVNAVERYSWKNALDD